MEKIQSIKQEINALHYLDEERLRFNTADHRTGLIPPEPIGSGLLRSYMRQSQIENQKEQKHSQMLTYFEKLAEPALFKLKPLNEIGLPPNWQEAVLPSEDLEQIYASTSILDFKEITVYSSSMLPLNFLNATPSKTIVHISHSFGGDSKLLDTSCLSVTPDHFNLSHLAIAGLEVIINPHVTGIFSASLNYIINKRYVYHVIIKAIIVPLEVKLDVNTLHLSMSDHNAEAKNGPSFFKFPTCTGMVELENCGNSTAWFDIGEDQLSLSEPPEIALLKSQVAEGSFALTPIRGSIGPYGKQTIKVTYTPGTKVNHEKLINISITDNNNPSEEKKVHFLSLALHGSNEGADCHLMLNTKQGPLDFGLIPISSKEDFPEICDPSLTVFAKTPGLKFSIQGMKSFKIKNNGSVPCSFVSFTNERVHEIEIKPNCGTIAPGQIVDMTVFVTPLTGGMVEDYVVINIIGGGKSYKIPLKYEGRRPQLEFAMAGPVLVQNIVLGSFGYQSYHITNKGSVFGRLVFDLSKFPDFSIQVRDEKVRDASPSLRRRTVTPPSQKPFNCTQFLNRVGVLNDRNFWVFNF